MIHRPREACSSGPPHSSSHGRRGEAWNSDIQGGPNSGKGVLQGSAKGAQMFHHPWEAWNSIPPPSILPIRSMERFIPSTPSALGGSYKGKGKEWQTKEPGSEEIARAPERWADGNECNQKCQWKPGDTGSQDASSLRESSWVDTQEEYSPCESASTEIEASPTLRKLRAAWLACYAAFGEESPITGQVKQAYTRACQGKGESKIHLQALQEYRLQAKEYRNTLHIISINRAKVVDEIMELYTDKIDRVENNLAIAQAEIQSLEDIVICNTSSHGNGSLAMATRPDADSEHEDALPVAPARLPVVDKKRKKGEQQVGDPANKMARPSHALTIFDTF